MDALPPRTSSAPHLQGSDSWHGYGLEEPVIADFVRKYANASIYMKSLDITPDGVLGSERIIRDPRTLSEFLDVKPLRTEVSMRILLVDELSAEALQIMSTKLNMHTGFWNWVASEQASDGSWLNTHDNGRILSFDLPCLEFYQANRAPKGKVVREGRLRQLSSRHRSFGTGLHSAIYEVFINRRVSMYLVNNEGVNTFIFLSEDCQKTSSFSLQKCNHTSPISTEWLLGELEKMEASRRVEFIEEPVGLVLHIVTKLLKTWHCFTIQAQTDLEHIDASLPESLPAELPERNLYDIGTYLHRDVVQTIFRFSQQLNKYEGYLKYLAVGTKDRWRPKHFMRDHEYLTFNVRDLRMRLDVLKERGNMSLTLINNYIALQQARRSTEQAQLAMFMAQIQQQDSQSTRRLSIVATIFLPLSFATSWLSTNGSTPEWIFVPIAVGSILATLVFVMFLKWKQSSRPKHSDMKSMREWITSSLHARQNDQLSDSGDSIRKEDISTLV